MVQGYIILEIMIVRYFIGSPKMTEELSSFFAPTWNLDLLAHVQQLIYDIILGNYFLYSYIYALEKWNIWSKSHYLACKMWVHGSASKESASNPNGVLHEPQTISSSSSKRWISFSCSACCSTSPKLWQILQSRTLTARISNLKKENSIVRLFFCAELYPAE